MNPDYIPVPVSAAKEIASRFQKSQVVIVAIDAAHKCAHHTTYGVSPKDKLEAAQISETINGVFTLGQKLKTFEDFREVPAAEAQAEIERLTAIVHVPGMWRCPQCGFVQINSTLAPGGVFVDHKPELRPCPNDGRDMEPMTYKQACENQEQVITQLMERLEHLES